MNVLFIGNSHTYFNDMPALFAHLAGQATGHRPRVTMLAYSNRNLEWHRREYYSLRFNLMYGEYDYCVIQQAAHPYPPVESTLRYGAEIIALCHRCGVVPVVFETWAEKRFPENQEIMIRTCEALAREQRALLAPVGSVWKNIREKHPGIELYYQDGEHAGPYGDFLIAAVFCRVLSGKLPEDAGGTGFDFLQGGPFELDLPLSVEDRDAVPVPLDREKTDLILAEVRDVCANRPAGTI